MMCFSSEGFLLIFLSFDHDFLSQQCWFSIVKSISCWGRTTKTLCHLNQLNQGFKIEKSHSTVIIAFHSNPLCFIKYHVPMYFAVPFSIVHCAIYLLLSLNLPKPCSKQAHEYQLIFSQDTQSIDEQVFLLFMYFCQWSFFHPQ